MSKTIDCYGRTVTSNYDVIRRVKPFATDIVKNGNYTYIRFTSDETCAIQRIDSSVTDATALRWGYGAWANK